jgi:hypothetical protein
MVSWDGGQRVWKLMLSGRVSMGREWTHVLTCWVLVLVLVQLLGQHLLRRVLGHEVRHCGGDVWMLRRCVSLLFWCLPLVLYMCSSATQCLYIQRERMRCVRYEYVVRYSKEGECDTSQHIPQSRYMYVRPLSPSPKELKRRKQALKHVSATNTFNDPASAHKGQQDRKIELAVVSSSMSVLIGGARSIPETSLAPCWNGNGEWCQWRA